jgi:hypothetical protein
MKGTDFIQTRNFAQEHIKDYAKIFPHICISARKEKENIFM